MKSPAWQYAGLDTESYNSLIVTTALILDELQDE